MFHSSKRVSYLLVSGLIASATLAVVVSVAVAAARPIGWMQSNVSGFGDTQNNTVSALAVLGGQMYAGTWNDDGAQVWRTADGRTWNDNTPAWEASNIEVSDTTPFGSHLYVGTSNLEGGEIWRTDGSTWQEVASGGLGDGNNYGMYALAEFGGALYVATANIPPAIGGTGNGVEVWRSSTGDPGSWGQVNSDGFGGGPTWLDVTMDVYEGYLYVGLSRVTVGDETLAELWRTNNGTTWTQVFVDGLGDANNSYVCAMAEFQGELYIGLRNATTGGQVWRSANGTNWTPVFVDGLGSPTNSRPYGLVAYAGRLIVVFSRFDGAQVWQTGDGASWQQVVSDGWGDGNNTFADYFDKGDALFGQALYIGTQNTVDGGEIWRTLNVVYLPVVFSAY